MTILSADEVRKTVGSPDIDVVTAAQVAAWLPEEPDDSHKGSCGFALVIAGSVNYTGAAFLAGSGAYRAGAGLVTIALPNSIHDVVAGLLPEATFLTLSEDLGVLAKPGAAVLLDEWDRYQAVLLGPGLTSQRPAREFVEALLASDDQPDHHASAPIGFQTRTGDAADDAADNTSDQAEPGDPAPDYPEPDANHRRPGRWVVDADGLNILADWPEGMSHLPANTVLTPHPGEMARLTGLTAAEINADRVGVATKHAADWGHVVALKGALTVIAAPDGGAAVVPIANPTLATAGSGDVMSGAVVGFLAQGLEPFEAAASGAFAHGLAGEIAAARHGRRGATARDVADCLSDAVELIESGQAEGANVTPDQLGAGTTTVVAALHRALRALERRERQ